MMHSTPSRHRLSNAFVTNSKQSTLDSLYGRMVKISAVSSVALFNLNNQNFADEGSNSFATELFASQKEVDSTPSSDVLVDSVNPKKDKEAIARAAREKLYSSVVKIFCDSTYPDVRQPWVKRPPQSCSGSGFAIAGRRIMTNAHCVEESTRLLVRKPEDTKRYVARVEALNHDCDLAVLKIDDEKFWENLTPLEFGDIPQQQESVSCVGYPTGGDQLSVTAGVVSRVDVNQYCQSKLNLPTIQIDAAINPGNSGGPALSKGKVVGVAFQGAFLSQNIGYIIPTVVINQFIADVDKNGKNTSVAALNCVTQTLMNPDIKESLGMNDIKESDLPKGVTNEGVLVTMVNKVIHENFKKEEEKKNGSSTDEVFGLKKNDVLLTLNGHDIGGDGTILLRGRERVPLEFAFAEFVPGEKIDALVLRDKKLQQIQIPLRPPNQLQPFIDKKRPPRYLVYGGVVFSADGKPSGATKYPKKEGQELISALQILPTELTIGYTLPKKAKLRKVDGVKIDSMKHLIEVLGQNKDKPFVEIQFHNRDKVVLNRKKIVQSTPEILTSHGISKPWSDDLIEACEKAFLPKQSK